MLLLIIAIFALLLNSLGTTKLVYDPPLSSLEKTNTTSTSLLLEPTNATDASLVFSSTNGTDSDPSLQWQNTTNTTSLNSGQRYSCSEIFGTNLNAESCIDAIEQIGLTDDIIHTYGYRKTGDKWDYNVPQRWISSDGLCVVNVDLAWGEPVSRSSERMIGQGAVLVLRWCVGDQSQANTGGLASNLGGDNNLQVSLLGSEPTAICYATMSSSLKTSCANIVDNMPYDGLLQIFGPSSDPEASVQLPLTLTSTDGLCAMTISTLGRSDIASWWDMWQGAMQLNGVCVKAGKKGKNPAIDTRGWATNTLLKGAAIEEL
ncbi:hypothetical protein JMJ35_000191 [Cladonia borealis]|uniref:Ecp2 effector protein domain-containing protein n=1 Tax=Cladonia borealis TaxID=184061 RepID=A0AA39RA86_9LECA|nr:hypothetical protein JMJ35_000191 [Cladonia borealis]